MPDQGVEVEEESGARMHEEEEVKIEDEKRRGSDQGKGHG